MRGVLAIRSIKMLEGVGLPSKSGNFEAKFYRCCSQAAWVTFVMPSVAFSLSKVADILRIADSLPVTSESKCFDQTNATLYEELFYDGISKRNLSVMKWLLRRMPGYFAMFLFL